MKQRRKTRFRGSKPSHGLDRPNPRSSFIGHSSAKFFSGIRSEGARNAKTRSTQPPEETTPTGLLPALQRCAKLRVAFSLHGISTAGGTTPLPLHRTVTISTALLVPFRLELTPPP